MQQVIRDENTCVFHFLSNGGVVLTKFLIINSDDFGLSKSVNRGIIESFYNGTVSSTTMMVNMPGFEDGVKLAEKEPNLGVGLHFNLSYGRPLTNHKEVSSLVDRNGDFNYQTEGSKEWRAEDVLKELKAQWDQLISSGLKPSHIDSHHLIHSLNPVYTVVAEFSKEQNVPIRLVDPVPSPKVAHPITTDRLIVDEYFHGEGKELFLSHVEKLEDGITELLCHPGYVDDDVRLISSWTDVRRTELRIFTDPEIAKEIKDAGIVLTNYRELRKILKK